MPHPEPIRLLLPRRLTVLHIDDDINDAELLKAAARKAKVDFVLRNVEDTEQAIAYLTNRGRYADSQLNPEPELILLDLKMPRANGFEMLKWIRKRPELAQVPVIVLSGSQLQDDIDQAYACGATSYQVKPLGFEALVQLVQSLVTLWLTTPRASLPASGPVLSAPPP